MKINKYYLATILLALFLTSCGDDDDGSDLIGNWAEKSVFDGTPRSNAVSFTSGNEGFMGTGYDGDDYLNDFWSYDLDGNFWSQKSDFPGIERSAAVAFTVGNSGFIGTGFDGDDELGDFYQYNISANSWTQIADFPGTARRSAVGFNSGTLGYVGTGFDGDNDKKDFYSYNPNTAEWNEVLGFGGSKRRDATVFTINEMAYFGTGVSNGVLEEDFWEFDMSTGNWTRKTDLDDEDEELFLLRTNAISFSLNGMGYLTMGNNGTGITESVWEYDPLSDTWEEKTRFENTAREGGISFYNEAKAFVSLGKIGNLYLDDTYEFFPNQEENEDD